MYNYHTIPKIELLKGMDIIHNRVSGSFIFIDRASHIYTERDNNITPIEKLSMRRSVDKIQKSREAHKIFDLAEHDLKNQCMIIGMHEDYIMTSCYEEECAKLKLQNEIDSSSMYGGPTLTFEFTPNMSMDNVLFGLKLRGDYENLYVLF